jgi:hypothetical protein
MGGAVAVGSASAAPRRVQEGPEAEQQLIDLYSPVIAARTQAEPCGEGEPYLPMAVDPLFDNPLMTLRGPAGETLTAPTADDFATRGDGWYFDIPGNALKPGCTYEQLYDSLDAPPTVYARIATDAERPGQIALQYWFFYLYNDWNDRHEGDWEMMQLLFDARDADAALLVEPKVVAFAQHEGGELSDWNGGPLSRVGGTHPVLYPGEGSHAAYFLSDHWFGKSAASGFGCDNTSSPTTDVSPAVITLDNAALPAWLSYEGRWGEKQPSFNTGPTGPNTKTQWSAPVRWVEDEGRRGGVTLPAGGSRVTDMFCTASAAGSRVMFRMLDTPILVGAIILALIVLLVVLIIRTKWSPVFVSPVAARRRGGQIIRTAFRIVRTNPRLFATIGLLIPVAGVVASGLQALLLDTTELGDVADVAGRGSFWGALLVLLIGAVVLVPVAAVANCASMAALRTLDEPTRSSPRAIIAGVRRNPRVILVGIGLITLLVATYATIVLIPLGWYLQARWAVAVPSALDGAKPFHRSAELTRGHRVRSFGLAAIATLIAVVLPPFIGTLVLLLTSASFAVVNVISGVIGLIAIPTAAVIVALQYFDLERRHGEAADGPPAS